MQYRILASILSATALTLSISACGTETPTQQSTLLEYYRRHDIPEYTAYKPIVREIREKANNESDIYNILDKNKNTVRFWNELTKTAKKEVVHAVWELLEHKLLEAPSLSMALKYARINDAIYYAESDNTILEILNPQLEKSLGYGHGGPSPDILKEIAINIRIGGKGKKGIYTSFDAFMAVYEKQVNTYMSGR